MLFTTYCQMRRISLPDSPENSRTLWDAFFGNSKQLQLHDSVHLSSVYTDYSFSSFIYFSFFLFITDYFSDARRAISPQCVYLCVCLECNFLTYAF